MRTRLRQALHAYAGAMLLQQAQNGFGYLLKPGEYNWGSTLRALNRALLLIMASESGTGSAWRQGSPWISSITCSGPTRTTSLSSRASAR